MTHYIHCWSCRHFKGCKRKYTPEVEGEIYTKHSSEVDEDGEPVIVLTDPQVCKNPLKTSKG